MSNDSRPIGIFDSGIGGLTVANAIKRLLPNEPIIYFGDSAHLPYGDKSADAIRYFSLRIAKFFLERNCKLIVMACNSASSTAYDTLIDFFGDEVVFLNVIDPLVSAVLESNYKKVGVIATKATIASNVYHSKLKSGNPTIEVIQQATPLLVPMIEEGFHKNEVSHSIIANYLGDESYKDIDALLLACTHYPLIKEEIQDFVSNTVHVLDPNEACAHQVKRTLEQHKISNSETSKVQDEFYVSDYTPSFLETTKMFYGDHVELKEVQIWK